MALLALLTLCLPMIGLLPGLLAVILNRNHPGWPRIVSYTCAIISLISTSGLLILVLFGGGN